MVYYESLKLKDTKVRVISSKGDITPCVFITVDKSKNCKSDKTVLIYGHLDKQPPLTEGWDDGLGPYKPVEMKRESGGKEYNFLYGRGSCDDGYSFFSTLFMVKAL